MQMHLLGKYDVMTALDDDTNPKTPQEVRTTYPPKLHTVMLNKGPSF